VEKTKVDAAGGECKKTYGHAEIGSFVKEGRGFSLKQKKRMTT